MNKVNALNIVFLETLHLLGTCHNFLFSNFLYAGAQGKAVSFNKYRYYVAVLVLNLVDDRYISC
jgi:hypothetical protein